MNDNEIAELIAKLDDADKPTIRSAVDSLIPLVGRFSAVQEMLSRCLGEERRKQKWSVAYVLAHLPQPSRRAITILLDALDHRDADIRWAIALLLVRIAKTQPDLVSDLLELCAGGTGNQKRMALYCLRDLDLSDAKSAAALLGALLDADITVRVAAAISLKSRLDIDRAGKNVLLKVYLNDRATRVRNAAAITLASLGDSSEEFLSALQEALVADDEQVRRTAIRALALIKKRSAPAEQKPR
jgi:HEAT repeat protein